MSRSIVFSGLLVLAFAASFAAASERPWLIAAAPNNPSAGQEEEKELSPEEKMARRFPQPVRVGDLIGLPVLDWRDNTLGFVRQVVRTPAGKIQLIVPYRRWFGRVSYEGVLSWGTRPVAVPIEKVAILGRQIAALDMPREEFDSAPTFSAAQASVVAPDETIRIAITRR
jgi:hypothetical protein